MTRMVIAVVLGVAMLPAAPSVNAAGEHKYVGVKKCKSCHKKELMGDQYGEWKKGIHSKAFHTLKSEEAQKIAKVKGLGVPAHESGECLKCHATAFGVDPSLMDKTPLEVRDGIQCESCHGPGKDYRKKTTMSDRKKSIAKGMWEPGKDESICTVCHNTDSPNWDPTRFRLADGSTVGFDFERAKKEIAHPIPEDVKGKYLELDKKLRAEKKARGESDQD